MNGQLQRRAFFALSGVIGGAGLAIIIATNGSALGWLFGAVLILTAGVVWNLGLSKGQQKLPKWARVLTMIGIVWVSAAVWQVIFEGLIKP